MSEYDRGFADGKAAERESWQSVLTDVSKREYLRGFNDGKADD